MGISRRSMIGNLLESDGSCLLLKAQLGPDNYAFAIFKIAGMNGLFEVFLAVACSKQSGPAQMDYFSANHKHPFAFVMQGFRMFRRHRHPRAHHFLDKEVYFSTRLSSASWHSKLAWHSRMSGASTLSALSAASPKCSNLFI